MQSHRGILVILLLAAGCSGKGSSATSLETSELSELRRLAEQVSKGPKDVRVRQEYAALLWQAGHHDRAEKQLRKACELVPTDEQAHMMLARVLLDAGRIDKARSVLTQAEARWQNSPWPHLLLGWMSYRAGEMAHSETSFRKALALVAQPSDRISAHLGLGAVLEKTGRQKEADSHYASAIAVEPELQGILIRIQKERLYPQAVATGKEGAGHAASETERQRHMEAILRQSNKR